MINVGLVGFGLSGRYLQAPFFETNPRFNLKTVVTSQMIPRHLFPHSKSTPNFSDILVDNDIQLISICSPSSTHHQYAMDVLNAGKHVLIEKPMAAKSSEAKEIFDLAASKNLSVFVYHNRRFDSDFLTLKKCIDSGILGTLHSYEAYFDRYKPLLNPKKWKESKQVANGILYDLGSHLIDQCISLFGVPLSYDGSVFTQREHSEIDDAFNLNLDYGYLKVRLGSSLLMKNPRPRFSVHGTMGSFVKPGVDIQEDMLVIDQWPTLPNFGIEPAHIEAQLDYTDSHNQAFKAKLVSHKGNWAALFDNIADVIIEGEKPYFKPNDILAQLQIIEKIRASSTVK